MATLSCSSKVLSDPIDKALERLWGVTWDLLEGGSTGKMVGANRFVFEIIWWVFHKKLSVREIRGSLNDNRYVMRFIGQGHFVLISDELGAKYCFSSEGHYGSFKIPGREGFHSGSAFYNLKSEYPGPPDEFLDKVNVQTSWMMNPEKEREAASFINRLCDTVELHKSPH